MQIVHQVGKNDQKESNAAIRTFLLGSVLVYSTALWHAFHTHTYFLVKLFSVEVAIACVAIFVAMKVFKH